MSLLLGVKLLHSCWVVCWMSVVAGLTSYFSNVRFSSIMAATNTYGEIAVIVQGRVEDEMLA